MFKALLDTIVSLRIEVSILITSQDSETIVDLVSGPTLEECLSEYFSEGRTVTIVDPASESGCTVDWDEFGESFSGMLVVAWGEHESVIHLLKDKLKAGHVFRGN